MELKDLESYGEPGAVVYLANCLEFMHLMPPESVDAVFADPPYRLSRGGLSVRSGRLVLVDKGEWDRSMGGVRKHYSACLCGHTTCRALSIGTDKPRVFTEFLERRSYAGWCRRTSEKLQISRWLST